ncbi:helix-turn-helix domain-containing protein [Paenibacillus sp. D2_2]|uniref:winged helix-turn-helix domain-containing protein n=1 Tax=Paenibacillus sp. D2_2 TaxID=3073092 RepID=UPI00281502A1|nr:helix-turn-helix domain-containing protein [Paenibacillus sp. D2_2]WMT38842.1 helix-turn-helix domain-containing protein [Paenibacillus sp. D2_2]
MLNLVWGEDFIGDPKTVDVHVRKLREKVEDDGSNPQWIETVWDSDIGGGRTDKTWAYRKGSWEAIWS